ncbi:hypothetical protein [Legionella sp. WA2022007384]
MKELVPYLTEAMLLLEEAYEQGRVVYFNDLVADNPRSAVQKVWGNIIKEGKENLSLAKVEYGFTDSKYFEEIHDLKLMGDSYPEYGRFIGRPKVSYQLKAGMKPSEALQDLFINSKMIFDCQVAITTSYYYAVLQFLKLHLGEELGTQRFDKLFGEGGRCMVLSKFSAHLGGTPGASVGGNLLAPFNPLIFFINSETSSSQNGNSGHSYYFMGHPSYLTKHFNGSDQGYNVIAVEEKPKRKSLGFGVGKIPLTDQELCEHIATSHNKPRQKWVNEPWAKKLPYDRSGLEKKYVNKIKAEDVTLPDAPNWTVNVENLNYMVEHAEDKLDFQLFLDEYDRYIAAEKKAVAHARLKYLILTKQAPLVNPEYLSKIPATGFFKKSLTSNEKIFREVMSQQNVNKREDHLNELMDSIEATAMSPNNCS